MDKVKEVITWFIFSTIVTVFAIFIAAADYKFLTFIGMSEFLIYVSVIGIIIVYTAIIIVSFVEMVGID